MKLIRKGTFETNSSSTHSIVIPKEKTSPDEVFTTGDSFTFQTGDYGWEFECYDFANYLWTAIIELSNDLTEDTTYVHPWSKEKCIIYTKDNWKNKIKEVLSPYYKHIIFKDPKLVHGAFNYDYYDNCSIDHVSELAELLYILYNDENLLLNSILRGDVYTGNDNDDEDDEYDLDTYEDNEDCFFVYYKGN